MPIGDTLARARQRAGLTVAQVSEQTRIREAVITGIEGDDYSASGGDHERERPAHDHGRRDHRHRRAPEQKRLHPDLPRPE